MRWTFYNSTDNNVMTFDNYYSLQHTEDTFKALVDSIIPRTPRLADLYGEIMYFGALDLLTDQYLIMSLNSLYIPLADVTAEMLDLAAELTDGKEKLLNYSRYPGGGTFAALPPNIRIFSLNLLDNFQLNYPALPAKIRENPEYFLSIMSNLNRFTMMGYYSEWYGYGATRLMTPNQRVLEFSPLSWTQVGYPGPSFSYRAQVLDYYNRRAEHEQ